jgi:hypothetical protein
MWRFKTDVAGDGMQADEFLQDLRGPCIFGMTAADPVLRREFEPAPTPAGDTCLPAMRLMRGPAAGV